MKCVCTICCKEKREDPGLLPARQRYTNKRIDFAGQESARLGLPFLIFSGKYGVIDADYEIPWYDQILLPEDVPAMINLLTSQLQEKNVSNLIFIAEQKSTPGWAPYYDALEQACKQLKIPITQHIINID